MKAVLIEQFSQRPTIQQVADPTPNSHGVVISVKATGVCRSDWHCWQGHDTDVVLPHVPGHEFAGIVETVGKDVSKFKVGDRVTVPFINACGSCNECHSGNHQVCGNQTQPGFTHWGSFAEYTTVDHADVNLVTLPEHMDFTTAASLGCRFVTAFRAVVDQGGVTAGQWVAVHGCGGVGLSAIMIAGAAGANVIAVDIAEDKLALAKSLGAVITLNANNTDDVAAAIKEVTNGGAHVSLDALGHPVTCVNSINCLRKLGKHIQVGLLLAEHATPPIPMDNVVANELQILGSHGMQAFRYNAMMALILSGKLQPEKLLGKTIALEDAIDAMVDMDTSTSVGVTVVTHF